MIHSIADGGSLFIFIGNEAELSSAQQMESQTKLRVETIEHEMSMETSRHAEAVAVLENKIKECDDAKTKTTELIDEKKAMIEAKKEELAKIWSVGLEACAFAPFVTP